MQRETSTNERPEPMRVWLLGGFRVSVGARTVEDEKWRVRKAASLVKLLALAPDHRLHREQAMDFLWPLLGREAASNNLRQVLYGARRTLYPTNGSLYLASDGETLVLCPRGDLWVDVDAFEEAATTARRTREPAIYRAALDLYAGDLPPEDRYETWTEGRREELRQLYLALLVGLAKLHEEVLEHEPAIDALRKATTEEPTFEDAQAGLMRLYAHAGRSEQALAQYEELRGILSKTLGKHPAEAIVRLRDEISAGRFPPPSESQRVEDPISMGNHTLPAPMTSFVGREREIVEVKRMLAMTRLLTLTGAGGSGKTRLALEVTRDLVGAFPDGVWLVQLAPLSESELVTQEVSRVLGVKELPNQYLDDTLAAALGRRELLIVMDNCEHIVDPVARLISRLLASCPRLKVLATSREVLAVSGEVNVPVPPLSLPPNTDGDHRGRPTVENLARSEAVRLFVDRVRQRLPDFELTEENARATARVCRKLDGIPLAIELATARMGTLTVEEVARRLEISLDVLKGSSRIGEARQRTLRATLDWSHGLLSEAERAVFRRLSVFAGGWTLEAAETVCTGEGIEVEDVLDLLGGLVDKSLVVAGATTVGTARYRMLEPIRQYAGEKLALSKDHQQTRFRHARWCLALAEEADKDSNGPAHAKWLERLETEHGNLRAALQWSLNGGDAELGLRLAGSLWLFWYSRGHGREGQNWLHTAISRCRSGATLARAKALKGAGWLALFRDEYETAKKLLEQSLTLSRQLGYTEGIASALTYLGFVAVLGDRGDIPVPAVLGEALRLKPQLEDMHTVGNLLVFEGLVAGSRGDLDRAAELHEEGLMLFRKVRNPHGMVMCLNNLGFIFLAQADYERASANFKEGLYLAQELDHKVIVQYSLLGMGSVATSMGSPALAARLWGAAESFYEAYNMRLTPLARSRTNYDGYLAAARRALGEAAFEEAWAEGKSVTLDEAVHYAHHAENADPAASPAVSKPAVVEPPGNLTRREREVASLVARGLTNRQISTELSISERTAANHVAKILHKLGLHSRAQIAAHTGLDAAEARDGTEPGRVASDG